MKKYRFDETFNLFVVFILLILVSLSGCVSKPLTVTKTVFVPLAINEELVKTVQPTTPPKREDYILASKDGRIAMLNVLSQNLYGDIAICNKRLTEIDMFNKKAVLIIEEKNKETQK